MTEQLAELLAVPDSRAGALTEIVRRLKSARHLILTTHINADGDGAGSQAAVAAWLEDLGVRITIVNPSPFPSNLRFLLHREDVAVDLGEPEADEAFRRADLALVLDTSEPNRLPGVAERLRSIPTIVVDHHPAGPSVVGEGGVQDPSASATGELVYDMLSLAGDPWPDAAALGMYVAIVSDTGSFRFGNTTPRTHAIAAELLGSGIDPDLVFQRLFAVAPPRRIHLLREALARLEHDPEAGLTWIVIPKEVTDRLGTTSEDYEGLIEHARSIEGTRVALMFREARSNETKVSFRSSGDTDVNRIARKFGGGGHVKASGATVPRGPDEAVAEVLREVRDALRTDG
jgi:bifunctional oligoribonuclease and PAP phosphatase NrnA